ncbi:alpha/beta hydrolase family protein [Sphingomonas panacisoli]|uniref:alpha/beta hydrolase family protein n=1 Tax=Sphingomonas panacisoli TaxID=1813879 RepID=UPI001648C70D|nr:S9 family peptidase [Sphingomonas panacisoli]
MALVAVVLATMAGAPRALAEAPAASTVPTAEDFGALPSLLAPVISPDGKRLVARSQVEGKPRLILFDLITNKQEPYSIALPDGHDLSSYRWVGNDKLLITLSSSASLLGVPIRFSQMIVYDIATRKVVPVVTGHGFGTDLTYVDPAGKFVLVTAQKTVFTYPSVFRFDFSTNEATEIVKPRERVWSWFADTSGTIRTGIASDGKKWWIYYRHDDRVDFSKSTGRTIRDDNNQIDTMAVTPDSDQGYAVATGASGRFGLYRYDFVADRLGELVYENPKVDVTDFDLTKSGQLESVSYTDDRARIRWFDPELKGVEAKLEKALPGMSIQIISMSDDRSKLVVWSTSASNPGVYYLYDRKVGRMMVIAAPFDQLIGKQLADMESVSYTARDGLDIPAYLTLPPGRAAKDLPLVIMPHGGPFARDEWSFDVWAQFLASRGYVVLQPNFRGSTGYRRQFVEKGNGQWGRGMQDDIDDGVKWLVARGLVDAKRVCIMGASFGGYAAEWAAVRNPDIYRCAISLAGVSDIAAQLKYDRKSFVAARYYRNWRDRVQGGNSVDLDAISPAKRAVDLKVPILIAHGDADTNVPPIQSKMLADALTKLGRPPEYYVYKGEGHGFSKPEDQIDFLKKVEAFLTKYNPA